MARLVQLTGTRAGGFVLTREEAAGKWAPQRNLFFGQQVDGAAGSLGSIFRRT